VHNYRPFKVSVQFSSVTQSCLTLCNPMNRSTPGLPVHHQQASLSITNSRSSLRLTSIESVMPSSHLILCRPLLLLPSIPPSIRVFSNELTLRMRWPKYWSFSFSIIPSKEIPGLIYRSILTPVYNRFLWYSTKHPYSLEFSGITHVVGKSEKK